MNKTEVIRHASQQIRTLDSKIILMEKLPEDWDYFFILAGEELLIEIASLDELHSIRQELKKIFGSWEDKISSVWVPYGTTVWVNWKGDVGEHVIKIRLSTSIDKFPSLKINPDSDCHFEKKEISWSEEYQYVCNK